jgi:hypothetical protein
MLDVPTPGGNEFARGTSVAFRRAGIATVSDCAP